MSTNSYLREMLNRANLNGTQYDNSPNLSTPSGYVPNPYYDPRLPAGNIHVPASNVNAPITYSEWNKSYDFIFKK